MLDEGGASRSLAARRLPSCRPARPPVSRLMVCKSTRNPGGAAACCPMSSSSATNSVRNGNKCCCSRMFDDGRRRRRPERFGCSSSLGRECLKGWFHKRKPDSAWKNVRLSQARSSPSTKPRCFAIGGAVLIGTPHRGFHGRAHSSVGRAADS